MIFNLFKSKPNLKEIIPDGFIDIHSHILPGVDDGAKDLDESLKIIDKLKQIGFKKIIGTPHTYAGVYNNTTDSIEKSYTELIKNNKSNIKLDFASEYMLDESILEKAEKGSLLTIKKQHVLIEMSYHSAPIDLFQKIFTLKMNNYIPVLAHPERYRFFHYDFDKYLKLKKHGCKCQINLFSITGYYGKDVLNTANKLIKNNLVEYLGSDIHNISQIKQFNKMVLIKEIKKLEKIMNSQIKF